jgi:hypothetical protein
VSPVKYGLGFYIPEDDILHSNCCEDLSSYTEDKVQGWQVLMLRLCHAHAHAFTDIALTQTTSAELTTVK